MALARRIIPCLDIRAGRVVKGVRFVDLRDAGDPVAHARFYEEEGADELVFLDITASVEDRGILLEVVRRVAEVLSIPFTVGGGVRDVEDFRALLRAGADKVSINTAAVQHPERITEAARRFGSQCVVVAIDAKRVGPDRWEVYIHGGRTPIWPSPARWPRRWGSPSSPPGGRGRRSISTEFSPRGRPTRPWPPPSSISASSASPISSAISRSAGSLSAWSDRVKRIAIPFSRRESACPLARIASSIW